MPKHSQSSGSSPKKPARLTAHEVIDMFRDFSLPVCDDEGAIIAKGDSYRERIVQYLRNPDPGQRAMGDRLSKNLEALKNRRNELHNIVFEHFARLADTALNAGIASGLTKLNRNLIDQLIKLAGEDCCCDCELGGRFLEQYKNLRGLQDGDEVFRADPVEDFDAASDIGKIHLSWRPPKQNCDCVEIRRKEESAGDESETIVYEGPGASFPDEGVRPGSRYTYRICSVFMDRFRSTDRIVHAVCMGEAEQVKLVLEEGRPCLTWECPDPKASVYIFRRIGKPPSVRIDKNGPASADKATESCFVGAGRSWKDPEPREGEEHHYRIVASFGPGLFTKGVDLKLKVPKPPPPVPSVTASYSFLRVRNEVSVEWKPVSFDVSAKYAVVRREGAAPAGKPEDGEIIETTAQLSYNDSNVVPGRRYTYTVFSLSGDLRSLNGTSAPPVDILADVGYIEANSADGAVEIRWREPANVTRLLVCRSLEKPSDHKDGKVMHCSAGTGGLRDKDLQNGRLYHYLVCCVYRPAGTDEFISQGVRVSCVPDRLPEPVKDFKVAAQAHEIVCTWRPLGYGEVAVVRSAQPPPGLSPSQRLTVEKMNPLGDRIVTTATGRAVDPSPDRKRPYYSVFTLAGNNVVYGGTAGGVVLPDVTDLSLSATRDGVILRWAWPSGCTSARVTRRTDTWPVGPEDQLAVRKQCMRSEYQSNGEKFVDKIDQGRGHFYYCVYAGISGENEVWYSTGKERSCAAEIQWEPWMTVRYKLEPVGGRVRRFRGIRLKWSVDDAFPDFHGFALVAHAEKIPVSLSDGEELFRWEPKKGKVEGEHEDLINVAPIHRRGWPWFYCKAVALNPAQRHSILFIHPNIAVPVMKDGKFQAPPPTGRGKGYKRRPPRTVICPTCFKEFLVEKIGFTSYRGEKPRQGNYSWWDRFLKQGIRPPQGDDGTRLTMKLCPDGHQLPYTAGIQSSLIIGLIGGKSSGKSHYVASLVKSLGEQVGRDFQANLMPLTDETTTRYKKEFWQPLFGEGVEINVTVGAPPPLIYDLTFDGRLWREKHNRGISLSLYDTAGENFNLAGTVQHMLQYLSVASGILFIVDPLQCEAVREAIPSSVPLPERDTYAEPNEIIGRVLTLLEGGAVLKTNEPLSTPVAVVLTKCDVLRDAGLIEPNRLWATQKRYIGYFDSRTHDDMNGMMGECVQRWSPLAYNTVRTRFSRYAFFGVSSTGCASDINTRRYKYVSPWRVEDPLLWLLAETGVIPRKESD